MRVPFTPRLLAAVTLLMTALAPLPGVAQQATEEAPRRVANGERFGAWTVQCDAIAVNETVCVLSQQLVRRSDRAFLAQLLAFSNGDGTRRFIAARVPLGVHFPSGFAIRPAESEEAEQTDFTWQSCTRELCEALVELTDERLALLTDETSWIGGYRPGLTAEALRFGFSTEGLAEGLAALGAGRGEASE